MGKCHHRDNGDVLVAIYPKTIYRRDIHVGVEKRRILAPCLVSRHILAVRPVVKQDN